MGRRQFAAMVRKDVLTELRSRQTVVSVLLFVVLAMVIFHFAFDPGGGADTSVLAGGMLWVLFAFASLLALNRTFAQEQDEDLLDALLLCPVDRVVVFAAKATANLLFLLVVEVIVVPLFGLFFVEGGLLRHLGPLALTILLGDVGICVVGTLLATMVASTRARDLLLPIVFLPLAVPLVIAATSASTALLAQDAGLGAVGGRLLFMAGYDAVFLVAAWGTYDHLLGE
jgi:heme exporter protein B